MFWIVKTHGGFETAQLDEIRTGCSYRFPFDYDAVIARYDTLEKAKKEGEKYLPQAELYFDAARGDIVEITEYIVIETSEMDDVPDPPRGKDVLRNHFLYDFTYDPLTRSVTGIRKHC